jgi:hypothetical protein
MIVIPGITHSQAKRQIALKTHSPKNRNKIVKNISHLIIFYLSRGKSFFFYYNGRKNEEIESASKVS